MALNDHLIRFIVHTAAENPRCRTIYRPRSEQLIEYLAHASKAREEEQEDAQRKAEQDRKDDEKSRDQRAYIEQRLRDLAKFEESFRPGYRSRRKRI